MWLNIGRTLTSAWIETFFRFFIGSLAFVALSRVRGLKHNLTGFMQSNINVALSRVRGLKHAHMEQAGSVDTSHSHECVD